MTPAGKRTHRIVFERNGASSDEYNEQGDAWSSIGSAMAAVYWGSGSERREAAREGGKQAASFVVLSTATVRGVTLSDRISYAGAAWDIEAILPDTPRRGEIEFNAARAV